MARSRPSPHRTSALRIFAMLALLAGTLASSEPAHATSLYVVNTLTDELDGDCEDGDCSLRDAIALSAPNDVVNFSVNGTFTLTLGELLIDHAVQIIGNGANKTIIDANGGSRVIHSVGGDIVYLYGLTLTGGSAYERGGGLYVEGGRVSLGLVAITGNSVTTFPFFSNHGGGIYLTGADALLYWSEVSDNTVVSGTVATGAGGIYVDNGELNIQNVTINGNHAGNSGGNGIGGGLLVGSGATVDLNNVTLAGNDADGFTGGIFVDDAASAVNFKNTIIADNWAPTSDPDCRAVDVDLNSQDYNLIEIASTGCEISGTTTHNITGWDPWLHALADNGGGTRTMALLGGSPAIDAGSDGACLDEDQRRISRPRGPHCDIGAYERLPDPADFDGDYDSDVVLYRGGAWLFFDFDTATPLPGVWTGNPGGACLPAPMDYDSDGDKDFTQLCSGAWNFYNDAGALVKGIWVGNIAGLKPVPADYDGDNVDDVVVFNAGAWNKYDYGTGAFVSGVWTGNPGGVGVPSPMDYDGNGTADPTILSGGAWHFYNDNGSYNKGIWVGSIAGQLPVPGDYDGDGTDEVWVFRAGAWLPYDFATGAYLGASSVWTGNPPPPAGGGATKPAPLDYDGDGTLDFTVFAGGPWHFYNDNGSYNKGIWVGKNAVDKPISRRMLP